MFFFLFIWSGRADCRVTHFLPYSWYASRAYFFVLLIADPFWMPDISPNLFKHGPLPLGLSSTLMDFECIRGWMGYPIRCSSAEGLSGFLSKHGTRTSLSLNERWIVRSRPKFILLVTVKGYDDEQVFHFTRPTLNIERVAYIAMHQKLALIYFSQSY